MTVCSPDTIWCAYSHVWWRCSNSSKRFQDRLTASGHGSLALSGGSPSYGAGASSAGGRGATGSLHHAAAMQHQLPQPDFQPPYFPPPFHHAAPSPPPQQHLEYLTDPYGGLSGLHHYNQLGLRREGDPNHAHVVSCLVVWHPVETLPTLDLNVTSNKTLHHLKGVWTVILTEVFQTSVANATTQIILISSRKCFMLTGICDVIQHHFDSRYSWITSELHWNIT